MARQHLLILVLASVLGVLTPGTDASNYALQLSATAHPQLQERTLQDRTMAMINMMDVSDRNLKQEFPKFTNAWETYKSDIQTDTTKKYCKDFKALLAIIGGLKTKADLVRSGINAKQSQLEQIRKILTGDKSKKSGIHCNEDGTTKHGICQILDKLDLENQEDELKLTNLEYDIGLEKANIDNYKCACTYDEWAKWGECIGGTVHPGHIGGCGDGLKERSRDKKWEKRNGGKDCPRFPKEDSEKEIGTCFSRCCPVDCEYSQWGQWSPCPPDCDGKKHTVSRTRDMTTQVFCKGKTCAEKYADGDKGTREEKECNILQVKEDRLTALDKEIAALEKVRVKYSTMMCSPNPCENGGHCKTEEVLNNGVYIPSATCNCLKQFKGPRCGIPV